METNTSQSRRERERVELRTKILNAARELFANEGFEAVTMRRIAEAIEYTPTTLYLYFKDKQALLNEICETDFAAFMQSLKPVAQIADPLERLGALGMAYVEFGLTHPSHYRLMFMTPATPDTEEGDVRKGNPEEDSYAFLVATVQEAIAAGCFRPELNDAQMIAQAAWAAAHGVVSLHLALCTDTWVDWRPVREKAELVNDSLLRGMVRDPR